MTQPGPISGQLIRFGVFELDTLDFATKNVRAVFEIDKDFSYGLSVSPDGRWILYSQVDDLKSEIMLVDHFR